MRPMTRCETNFHKWGRVQGMEPNALPLWELHLCRSYEPWLERKTSTKLRPYDTIKFFLKRRCLKCPHIAHLDLICMSYDQKKGQESNSHDHKLPWEQGSNELWLGCVIHCWKDLFEGYKIFPLHYNKKRLIWERYEHPKFLDNKSLNFETSIWEF